MREFIMPIEIENKTLMQQEVRLFDYYEVFKNMNKPGEQPLLIYKYLPNINYEQLVISSTTSPLLIYGMQTNIEDGRESHIENININSGFSKSEPFNLFKELESFKIEINGYNVLITSIMPGERIKFYLHVHKHFDRTRELAGLDPMITYKNRYVKN